MCAEATSATSTSRAARRSRRWSTRGGVSCTRCPAALGACCPSRTFARRPPVAACGDRSRCALREATGACSRSRMGPRTRWCSWRARSTRGKTRSIACSASCSSRLPSRSSWHRWPATRSPQQRCAPSRPCGAALPRCRQRRPDGSRCRRAEMRSPGWRRPSTRCSPGSRRPSSTSAGSSPMRATSCARPWRCCVPRSRSPYGVLAARRSSRRPCDRRARRRSACRAWPRI